jgi:hypothetical protein
VNSSFAPPEPAHCEEGGSKFVAGATTTYACNGADGVDGSPWTVEGLPPGATETGTWNVVAMKGNDPTALGSISFTVPLTEGLDASHVHYVQTGETAAGNCTGTVLDPTAASGHLCVYEAANPGTLSPGVILTPDLENSGAGSSGAVLFFLNDTTGNWYTAGSWAVTG